MTLTDIRRGLKPRLWLISLAVMLLSLALPIAMLQIYDRILPNQGIGTAWVLTAGVLSAMILEAGLRYGRSWLLNRTGMKFEAWSSVAAMHHLLNAPAAELRKLGRHGIEESLLALKRYQDYYSGQALLALYDTPFILLFLLMIAYIGGWVVVIPLLVLVAAFITVYLLGRQAHHYSVSSDEALAERAPVMLEAFSRLLPLKGLAMEGALFRAFDVKHRNLAVEQAWLDEYMMRIQLVTQFFSQGTTVLVVMFSAHLVIGGDMSSGALAACTLLAGRVMAPVGALFSFWGQIQRSGVMQQKAQALLGSGSSYRFEQRPEQVGTAEPQPIAMQVTELRIPTIQTTFGFEIEPGALLWLREPGWLRWSPWFDALTGRGDLEAGHWRFANADGSELDYVPRIALVGERVRIFQGSVMENLTLFTPERELLAQQWAQRLGVHPRIIQLPQGYQTPLGEHYGSGVGRGMEQLIGLVRALASTPDLLLLDHADRGLDLPSRKRVAEQLVTLQGQLTCLVATTAPEWQAVLQPAAVELGGAK